jgi:hypothetical protein
MAAAGAAGVGMLAMAQPAEARIVYTPANTTINNSATIDLNNDGIGDFAVGFHVIDKSLALAVGPLVAGNEIKINGSWAGAGFFGVPVGPGGKFAATNGGYSFGLFMAFLGGYASTSNALGPWANVANRYLGFKFLINGQVHYGWARLSVSSTLSNILLTGYAYETTANTPIIEGHTSGREKANTPSNLLVPSSQPASLGMLARGADALAIWRRDDETTPQE